MNSSPNIEIANIVASGKIAKEIDLAAISSSSQFTNKDLIESIDHRQKQGNRLFIRFVDNESLCILTTSGVYILTGGKTYGGTKEAQQRLFDILASLNILSNSDPGLDEIDREYEIRNIVFVADLESELDLDTVAIQLGFEHTEYEPEQFPGLIYRPPNKNCTILIFSTGKIVITGIQGQKVATEAISNLQFQISKPISE